MKNKSNCKECFSYNACWIQNKVSKIKRSRKPYNNKPLLIKEFIKCPCHNCIIKMMCDHACRKFYAYEKKIDDLVSIA